MAPHTHYPPMIKVMLRLGHFALDVVSGLCALLGALLVTGLILLAGGYLLHRWLHRESRWSAVKPVTSPL